MNLTVIGSGLVGTITAATISSKTGYNVFVFDRDIVRIRYWNSKNFPIFEPQLDSLIDSCHSLTFTTDIDSIRNADIVVLAVDTPIEQSTQSISLRNLKDACMLIAQNSNTDKIIVEKSTVPVNTACTIKELLSSNTRCKFQVLSNPEFLSQGTAVVDCLYPDRILIGCDNTEKGLQAQKTLADIYACWVPRHKILTQRLWSAELSKLASNAFLAQRISSLNSLSAVCEATGANIEEVSESIGSDKRIGLHYLRVLEALVLRKLDLLNLVYLCRSCNIPEVANYWMQVIEMNNYQINRFSKRVIETLKCYETPKVSVLGLAYKKDTGDTRMSPSIKVIKEVLETNSIKASVTVYDPKVTPIQITNELDDKVTVAHSIIEATKGAHMILILTNWDEFYTTLKWIDIYQEMEKPAWIFNGHLGLKIEELRDIGFNVYQIGY
ncbi:nucleotide sugar dehydrogenase [Wallemia mellicola]|uniref:UDP-glucose 6-dehydrogenase n=1 Tax=Wallemia mellicola TaxID=1708541 RepID=A0A4T0MIL8_9BASI|nr:nucleotide sugar dehydrogenase [Wallemia mellicola]